jgi:hypothetical protein
MRSFHEHDGTWPTFNGLIMHNNRELLNTGHTLDSDKFNFKCISAILLFHGL